MEGISEFKLLQDWKWYPEINKFYLRCTLNIQSLSGKQISPSTNWYIIVDRTYPLGLLNFIQIGLMVLIKHLSINHLIA